MAGIGFELKRVLAKGGVARFLTVSLAGTAVVAGPWLISVMGIFAIQSLSRSAIREAPTLFSAVIIFCNSLSLILFGGPHYVFTRRLSDLIYERKDREAGGALLQFLALTAAGALLLGLPGAAFLGADGVSRPVLFRLAAAFLFLIVNLNWVIMGFISLLKSYLGILFAYLGGALLSVAGTAVLGGLWGAAGALLGYTAGQVLTVGVLYAMSLARYAPVRLPWGPLWASFSRYRWLLLAGVFYTWAVWVDKAVAWFLLGSPAGGGWIHVYDPYDVPIFFAVLTLIPSLLYFTLETETSYYPALQGFLRSLGGGRYEEIQARKRTAASAMWSGLREQGILQAVCTAVLVLLAPQIVQSVFGGGIDVAVLRLTLVAVFFHSLFLCLLIFLFYLEMHAQAFLSSVVFFLVNLASSLAIALAGATGLLGGSYLLAAAVGSMVAFRFLVRAADRIDRLLFLRATQTGKRRKERNTEAAPVAAHAAPRRKRVRRVPAAPHADR